MRIHLLPGIALLGAAMLHCASCSTPDRNTGTELPVIPLPNSVTYTGESMPMPEAWSISAPEGSEPGARVMAYAASTLGATQADSAQALITLAYCDTMPHEAYRLSTGPDGAVIWSGESGAGWFYGLQTLIQMANGASGNEIPGVDVDDAPRFIHRGAMMDHARWFLGMDETLRFIDLMALYKLNTLHLHLTDDQGWRIEIKQYPRLTEVGAWRPHTQIGHSYDSVEAVMDGVPHGGFFTQDDIRRIVEHARTRFITVIPEIEMPGHASAALASYPELSCGLGKTYIVQPEFDVFDEVFCPREHTFEFLCNVLDEVIDLFPSELIHIGGDECPKKAWAKCDHCQAMIKDLGLADEHELQSYFITRIGEHVASRGRSIIGWDEILEGGLAPGATVMSWRGTEGGKAAVRAGHRAIMTPTAYCYHDYYQEPPEGAPLAWGGFTPIDSVYSYDPVPSDIPDSLAHLIIGTQANIWGEYIPTPQKFEYMAFPRLLAMSEVQWTEPALKDYDRFAKRLRSEFERLDTLGVRACRVFLNETINEPTEND